MLDRQSITFTALRWYFLLERNQHALKNSKHIRETCTILPLDLSESRSASHLAKDDLLLQTLKEEKTTHERLDPHRSNCHATGSK